MTNDQALSESWLSTLSLIATNPQITAETNSSVQGIMVGIEIVAFGWGFSPGASILVAYKGKVSYSLECENEGILIGGVFTLWWAVREERVKVRLR